MEDKVDTGDAVMFCYMDRTRTTRICAVSISGQPVCGTSLACGRLARPFPRPTRPGQPTRMTRTSRTSGTSLHFALFLLVKKLVRVLVRILPAGEMWYEFGLWPFTAALSPDPPDPGQF